jgi:hypothetical protein
VLRQVIRQRHLVLLSNSLLCHQMFLANRRSLLASSRIPTVVALPTVGALCGGYRDLFFPPGTDRIRRSKSTDRIRRSKGADRIRRPKGTVNPWFQVFTFVTNLHHPHTLRPPVASPTHTPLIPVVYLIYLASQISVTHPRHRSGDLGT